MPIIKSDSSIVNRNIKDLIYQQWSQVPGLLKVETKIKPFHLEGDVDQPYFQLGWMSFDGIVIPLAMIIRTGDCISSADQSNLIIQFQNLYNRNDPEIYNLVNHLRRSYPKSYLAFEKYLLAGTSNKNRVPGMNSLNEWLTDNLTFKTAHALLMPNSILNDMTLSVKRLHQLYKLDAPIDWNKIRNYKKSKKGVQ